MQSDSEVNISLREQRTERNVKSDGLLAPYRVIDLTDQNGILAGKILADLGADVIAVEPPMGNPVRRIGPFYKNRTNLERSLTWWAYAAGKRSIILDIESQADAETFNDLVAGSDFLLESFPPGYLDELGIGYQDLKMLNQRLVMVSMTPFGQTGPYSKFNSSDIVGLALGGLLNLTGDVNRAPLRVSQPQFGSLTATSGVVGAMIAHHARLISGLGQHVDVSGQQSVARCLSEAPSTWNLNKVNVTRGGAFRGPAGGKKQRILWPCKDGYITLMLLGGNMGKSTNALMQWMTEEGLPKNDIDWTEAGFRGVPLDAQDNLEKTLETFFLERTKAYLYKGALARRILMFPVNSPGDILKEPQLAARRFFRSIEHPEEGKVFEYPGSFVDSSIKTIGPWKRAPFLGEHTNEILNEISTNSTKGNNRKFDQSKQRSTKQHKHTNRHAFDGLKVLDFCWVGIGPITTRYLADHGATVIRVESGKHVETLRTAGPYKDGIPGINRSGYFANYNANKLGISLDLRNKKTRNVINKLVQWADVVTENFTPGTMERWNLGYDSLKNIKPDTILFSASMLGRGGPNDRQPGFGNLLASLAGFPHFCGWADSTPISPYGAYTDFFLARFALTSIVAAIDHKERTGLGQHLDFSQLEGALQFMAPALLNYTTNQQEGTRCGNASNLAAPHGVYPSKGDDRWCAISISTHGQWKALCQSMEATGSIIERKFDSLQSRKENEVEIDQVIGKWTRQFDSVSLMKKLQNAGVPCGAVNRCEDLVTDQQLSHRKHYVSMDHMELGKHTFDGTEFVLSDTPALYKWASPLLGEHNSYVFKEILGLSDEEVEELVVNGALD